MKAILAFCCLLTGCAVMPQTVRIGAEHISHPFAGRPFGPQAGSEDILNQATITGEWTGQHWYVEAGFGQNLKGRNGSGFYGPALTGIVRAGVQVSVRHE